MTIHEWIESLNCGATIEEKSDMEGEFVWLSYIGPQPEALPDGWSTKDSCGLVTLIDRGGVKRGSISPSSATDHVSWLALRRRFFVCAAPVVDDETRLTRDMVWDAKKNAELWSSDDYRETDYKSAVARYGQALEVLKGLFPDRLDPLAYWDSDPEISFESVAKLYAVGLISSSQGAQLCGMSRVGFLFRLPSVGVPISNLTVDDIDDEF